MNIGINGDGMVRALAPVSATDLELSIEGNGKFEATVYAVNINSEIEGSGKITIQGTSTYHPINVDGEASTHAYSLETETTDIDVAGHATCRVNATSELNVDIDGVGEITYPGSPAVHQNIDGVRSVSPR